MPRQHDNKHSVRPALLSCDCGSASETGNAASGFFPCVHHRESGADAYVPCPSPHPVHKTQGVTTSVKTVLRRGRGMRSATHLGVVLRFLCGGLEAAWCHKGMHSVPLSRGTCTEAARAAPIAGPISVGRCESWWHHARHGAEAGHTSLRRSRESQTGQGLQCRAQCVTSQRTPSDPHRAAA